MSGTNLAPEEPGELLRMIVNRTMELAPLRAVATKAIQMAEDEHSAAMDLAAVLSSDQALTAKLLKLSNSAYYGYARRIGNVREAVILLGMRTVRSVAIASSIIDAFDVEEVEGFDRDLFWAHSVCTGLVAEAIAKETRVARPEDAFTAGVLHDVGKLAMLLAEPRRFRAAVKLTTRDGLNWHDAEVATFGVGHQYIGARLAQRWKFPEPLVSALKHHHDPLRSTVDSMNDVVAAANLACNRAGLACGFDWTREPERWARATLPPRVDDALDRVNGGIRSVEDRARAFLLHVSSKPPRWYHGPDEPAADDEEMVSDEPAA
ncbi:MAG: HDOD domain-containing protein [Dehalococcoidia bacterium]|nr:HDOD domain-containing protein [Dehalococcoidia bacterium]MCA9824008.1 HDOD domain-containing protein [Dehalococcoidia bacterium]MCA9843084.1 HDOD domain-containing protein [Dehalococcoidia bacterium]